MAYKEQGVDALAANLRAMGARMEKDGAVRAARAGAKVILAAQVEQTSEFKGTKLGKSSLERGELKESLKIRSSFKDGVATAKIGPGNQRTRKAAYLVEFGHRQVTGGKSRLGLSGKYIGPGKAKTKDVPPEPFLRPAFEESESAAEAATAAEVVQQIEGKGV